MSKTQVSRLKKDIEDLENYANRLKRRGQKDLLSKIVQKTEFLKMHVQEQMQRTA